MVNSPILQMFARSPFKPMQEHIVKAQAGAAELIPFFEAVIADDWEAAEAAQQRITTFEHEADDLKRDIRQRLPASLFLPVPRTDLLEMLRLQDKLANRAKDISGLMLGRQMQIPEPIQAGLLDLLRTALKASEQAVSALNELDELLNAGFRGHEVDIVERLITELDELEHDADNHERQLRSSLFAVERDLYPIDVMFLYQIIQWVGDLANLSQQVGNRLQQLLAR